MPLYTHARQFPHLMGRSDPDIRALARRAVLRRPRLVRVVRLWNVAVVAGMVATAAVLGRVGRDGGPGVGGAMLGVGFAVMAAGAGATAVILLWNLVWVNTVLYRVTRDEVQRQDAEPGAAADGGGM
jgi:hypothetical protein